MNRKQYTSHLTSIHESSNLVVYQPDENGIMIAEWSGFLSAAIGKDGCMSMLECLQAYPVKKILNCNKQVTGHYAGAIEWVGKVWFSELHRLGLEHFAWVYSPEFYTQVGTDEVISFNEKISTQTFYSFDSAYQWLLDQ